MSLSKQAFTGLFLVAFLASFLFGGMGQVLAVELNPDEAIFEDDFVPDDCSYLKEESDELFDLCEIARTHNAPVMRTTMAMSMLVLQSMADLCGYKLKDAEALEELLRFTVNSEEMLAVQADVVEMMKAEYAEDPEKFCALDKGMEDIFE